MDFNCVIPAAGYGKRLLSLTIDTPKALLPLNEATVLDHILSRLYELPHLGEICILTNETYFEKFRIWLNQTEKSKITLISNNVNDRNLAQGANKDTWSAINQVGWHDKDILIMGSDNYMPESLVECSKWFTNGKSSVVATCDYSTKEKVKKLVVPEINEQNIVTNIVEKPLEPNSTFGCPLIYFIKNKDLKYLELLAKEGRDNIGHLLELIVKNSQLRAYVFKELIVDIGTLEDYTAIIKK